MNLKHALARLILLPPTITDFERRYLESVNRTAWRFFALHIPVFTLVALVNDTNPWLAVALTSLAMVGPSIGHVVFKQHPRRLSMMYGFVAMVMGGLLVHFGAGPVQIEMHFYFFALIAICAVFANPMVIVVAALTVTVHHLLLWWLLPSSVFNYDAPIWVVFVHAAFVVLESVVAVIIARKFFDNIIGLDSIVQQRTIEVRRRNDEMATILQYNEQGLAVLAMDLTLAGARSATFVRWLGEGEDLRLLLQRVDPSFAAAFEAAWMQVQDGFLPLDVSLAQLPGTLHLADGSTLGMKVVPVAAADSASGFLVVLTDESGRLADERAQAFVLAVERCLNDPIGFSEFLDEGDKLIKKICDQSDADESQLMRDIHTLKGNSLLFEAVDVANQCHTVESRLAADPGPLTSQEQNELVEAWEGMAARLRPFLDERSELAVYVCDADIDDLIKAIDGGASPSWLKEALVRLRHEPMKNRFASVGTQARQLAKRLGRGELHIVVDDGDVRMDPKRFAPFWSSFSHLIRNAIDHGFEANDDGAASTKTPTLELRARASPTSVAIELRDNGRGIDWDKLASAAERRMGVSVDRGEASLQELLFTDGISTRDVATEVSGRGVGLSAVRAACVSLGGTITVQSRKGAGTTFRATLPLRQSASPIRVQPGENHSWI